MASLERSDGEELWLWRDDGSCGCGICKLGEGSGGGKERMEDDRERHGLDWFLWMEEWQDRSLFRGF